MAPNSFQQSELAMLLMDGNEKRYVYDGTQCTCVNGRKTLKTYSELAEGRAQGMFSLSKNVLVKVYTEYVRYSMHPHTTQTCLEMPDLKVLSGSVKI